MVSQDNVTSQDNGSGDVPSQAQARRQVRQLALQYLYQLDVQSAMARDQGQMISDIEVESRNLQMFLSENCTNPQISQLARQWIKSVWESRTHIDKIIQESSSNWDIARLSPVDHSNLRLAVWQLLDCPDIPPKVVINEAIELAKHFSTDQAPKFVNGVLDAIWHKIAADTGRE
jgi:transcription antitermination protein NusB